MHLNIAVGIPTIGRPSVLRETLAELARQARPPDCVIICATKPADIDGAIEAADTVRLIVSEPGLARQRNAVIAAASEADVVVFFDDDFLPHPEYLAAVDHYMTADPRVVVATGRVLADGIGGPGLSTGEARAILAEDVAPEPKIKQTFS